MMTRSKYIHFLLQINTRVPTSLGLSLFSLGKIGFSLLQCEKPRERPTDPTGKNDKKGTTDPRELSAAWAVAHSRLLLPLLIAAA